MKSASAMALIVAGLALIAAYLAMQPPPQTPPPTPTTASTPTTGATTGRTAPLPTPPTTATTPTTTTQTNQATTTTTTAKAPIYAPAFDVSVEAPARINTTRLPIAINYTIVIKNIGNGTGTAHVGSKYYRLAPGETIRINATAAVAVAGETELVADVNGTRYAKTVKVLYFTPVLEAEPVAVNATKLPANITVGIRVKSRGNLTAMVAGVEIKPGEERIINKTIYVRAAGAYTVDIGGVEVPLEVKYYAPNLEWRLGGPHEVEAIPGEAVTAWLWLKNSGNATLSLYVDGKEVVLPPAGEVNITKQVVVERAGGYNVEYRLSGYVNATLLHVIRARIVTHVVRFVLVSPEQRTRLATPNGEEGVVLWVQSRSITATWGYIISSNATKKALRLYIKDPDGAYQAIIAPGQRISKNFTATLEVPGRSFEIWVNFTVYKFTISLQLTPPKVTVRDISRIEFTDSRELSGLTITCIHPETRIPVPVKFDVVRVSGTLVYTPGGREISGSIAVRHAGEVKSGSFSGSITGDRGYLKLDVLGHSVYVEFAGQPPSITRLLVDGKPIQCDDPLGLVPGIFYSDKPTAE
ncbi:MAG: hypothetical protein QW492_12105, partial [Pyrobaculum sp.]